MSDFVPGKKPEKNTDTPSGTDAAATNATPADKPAPPAQTPAGKPPGSGDSGNKVPARKSPEKGSPDQKPPGKGKPGDAGGKIPSGPTDGGSKKTKQADIQPNWSRLMVLLIVVVGITVAILYIRQKPTGFQFQSENSSVSSVPAIGGPFSLIDHNDRAVTEADFLGKYMLVYFGYTYCPDVCPTSLTAMSDALNILGTAGDRVTPLFITIDPMRDRPDDLKVYVGFFHPRMIGLSGTPEQVAKVAKSYLVYFAKVSDPAADDDDYTMDHTTLIYLMGPDGKLISHFSHGTSPEDMARRIRELL